MVERLIIVFALAGIGLLTYRVFTRRHLKQAAGAVRDHVLGSFRPGVPAIVYFSTPFCAPCQTQQSPALSRLAAELGDSVQIIRVDAAEHTDVAERWGVFSVPTTFVLNGAGQPRHVNHGVADAAKLRSQLMAVRATAPAVGR